MSTRGSTAVVRELIQVYPEEVVVGQLKQLYRSEIRRTMWNLYALLPTYKARVDEGTFVQERATFLAYVARSDDDTLGVQELERLLKALLHQEQKLMRAPSLF